MKYECKILIGTTFCGKSTYAAKHQYTHKIIETDIVKYDSQRGNLSITDYVNQLISNEKDVILDQTKCGKAELIDLIEKIKEHHNVKLVIFDVSYKQILANRAYSDRNVRKSPKTENYIQERFNEWTRQKDAILNLEYDKEIIHDYINDGIDDFLS